MKASTLPSSYEVKLNEYPAVSDAQKYRAAIDIFQNLVDGSEYNPKKVNEIVQGSQYPTNIRILNSIETLRRAELLSRKTQAVVVVAREHAPAIADALE